MAGFHNLTIEWVIRIVIAVRLGAHISLALLAGIRRHKATGFLTIVLWLAYQVANWAAPFVLSNLSLGSTPREQQLVAFWLPCLVAHLGGPDNITAYSLEDNKTFLRQFVSTASEVKILGGEGTLFWASLVMVGVGVCKYLERFWALSKADFGNIRSSSKNRSETLKINGQRRGRRKLLENEQALLVAHELLDITKGAFADYSVKEDQLKNDANLKEIFSVYWGNNGWNNMCKVVEMELSLMYDILYTKAAVIHTWFGYSIRVISPMVTAMVIVLFWLYSKEGQRTADVFITYILLVVTLLLDVRWLLGAAASTWTYAFFNASPERWLHHEVCCTVWWHRLRRFVVSLDPWQLPLREHGGGYRLCSLSSWMAKKLSLEDDWMEYKYSSRLQLGSAKNVKELLFKQIQEALNMVAALGGKERKKPEEMRPVPPPRLPDAAPAHQRRRDLDEELGFLPEFQELILIWHVATDVFLLCSHEQGTTRHHQERYVKAIKAVSDYMAFLAAERPEMLPGLKLRSLHQATRQALDILWKSERRLTSTTGDEK
uniref:DUF4220 domain-containing protein n=2 Tax=Setaria italica TaxID=4555 RepID=K3ZL78_SETIT